MSDQGSSSAMDSESQPQRKRIAVAVGLPFASPFVEKKLTAISVDVAANARSDAAVTRVKVNPVRTARMQG